MECLISTCRRFYTLEIVDKKQHSAYYCHIEIANITYIYILDIYLNKNGFSKYLFLSLVLVASFI